MHLEDVESVKELVLKELFEIFGRDFSHIKKFVIVKNGGVYGISQSGIKLRLISHEKLKRTLRELKIPREEFEKLLLLYNASNKFLEISEEVGKEELELLVLKRSSLEFLKELFPFRKLQKVAEEEKPIYVSKEKHVYRIYAIEDGKICLSIRTLRCCSFVGKKHKYLGKYPFSLRSYNHFLLAYKLKHLLYSSIPILIGGKL